MLSCTSLWEFLIQYFVVCVACCIMYAISVSQECVRQTTIQFLECILTLVRLLIALSIMSSALCLEGDGKHELVECLTGRPLRSLL